MIKYTEQTGSAGWAACVVGYIDKVQGSFVGYWTRRRIIITTGSTDFKIPFYYSS